LADNRLNLFYWKKFDFEQKNKKKNMHGYDNGSKLNNTTILVAVRIFPILYQIAVDAKSPWLC